ncbi:MAG: DNA polymerase III subunit epsilon [Nitrospirae bacterium]|nr:MAG: DNA polymerase III subunit epsilon [Nitrospirota bacterium]
MVKGLFDIFRSAELLTVTIDPDAPISESRFVVLDTELTGLDQRRDSLISIGALRMAGSKIELGTYFDRMINPERVMNPKSVVIHGVMPSEVELEPPLKPILGEFLSYCKDSVLVGHCIDVDLFYLNKELRALLGRELGYPVVDTYSLYEWLTGRGVLRPQKASGGASTALFAIADDLGIPAASAHTALGDAYTTAQVFQRFLSMLRREEITTIGGLLRIGNPAGGGTRALPAGQMSNF